MLSRPRFGVLLLTLCVLAAPALRAQDARADRASASQTAASDSGEYIELTTGERHYGRVEFHDPAFRNRYLTIDDSTRFELGKVRAYQSSEGYFRRVSGSQVKFARLVRSGRLDLYERSEFVLGPTMVMPGAPGSPPVVTGGGGGTASFDYFAKGDGEVHPLKYGPLREALADDPASLRYLNQYRTLGIVQIGLAVGGLGLAVASLTGLEKGDDPPPLLFVGAGIATTAWIPHLMRGGKLEAAVDSYNRYRLEQ